MFANVGREGCCTGWEGCRTGLLSRAALVWIPCCSVCLSFTHCLSVWFKDRTVLLSNAPVVFIGIAAIAFPPSVAF